jgi:outer membrane protein assembly factor BamA
MCKNQLPYFLILLIAYLPLYSQKDPDSSHALVTQEILSTHRTRINAYPYVYYTPETEVAFGVGGIVTFYTARDRIMRPSKAVLNGYYSTKKQYKITLAPQVYFLKNRYFFSANLDYGYYVDKFWGVGWDTPEIENEQYISSGWGAEVQFHMPALTKLIHADKLGFIYDYYNSTIRDKKDNPNLLDPNTRGNEGGISSGLGLVWLWDNRDNIFFPKKGGYHRLKVVYYQQELGSDFDYNRYEVDLRRYTSMITNWVVAWQVFFSQVGGYAPFYKLSALGGGQIMRGYYYGRYRDKIYLAGQVELRRFFWKRLGGVVFAGMGGVNDDYDRMTLRHTRFSWGGGLRFKFNEAEKVNIRMDIGFGKKVSGVYFGMEEAF